MISLDLTHPLRLAIFVTEGSQTIRSLFYGAGQIFSITSLLTIVTSSVTVLARKSHGMLHNSLTTTTGHEITWNNNSPEILD